MNREIKVHIVGTHGVPARYGGFETLADFLCENLESDNRIKITVYCNSNLYEDRLDFYKGAELIYLNLDASGWKGIIYDVWTYLRSLIKADVILYLSPVGSGFIIPFKVFTNKKVIVNHGGLNEWEREKLSFFQKKWAKLNHSIASRFANVNIADNYLYKNSLQENFGSDSLVIRYGGDHVYHVKKNEELLNKYAWSNSKYVMSVSRAQIDNNLHIVLEAFESINHIPLVLVSNWSISNYGIQLKKKYGNKRNIILLDAIYDKHELNYLRSNAYYYIHSHSRCGTAPSLVEAMSLGKAILSFDVATNRETTHEKAIYFSDTKSLIKQVEVMTEEIVEGIGYQMEEIAKNNYTWKHISEEYLKLFLA